MNKYSKAEILQKMEEEGVEFIRLQFTDMFGVLKNIAVPASRLIKVLENNCTIDCASLDGFVNGEEEYLYLKPDLDTFAILPWRPQNGKVARFLCDICREDGSEYEISSRWILKKSLERAASMGYTFQVNPECEFFLFHTDDNGLPTTLTHEKAGYLDTSPVDLGENTRRDIILTLEKMGYEIESSHHEIASAQHEIDFSYEDALGTADKLMTFKMTVRTIAKRYGLHGELSRTGEAFIAGIFQHIAGMTAILNPLVNSYKRLVPGFEAPSDVTWSRTQRNPLIRVCKKRDRSVNLELRSPDAASNPYLVFALCLEAGLNGIQRGLKAPEELKEDIRRLSCEEKQARGIQTLPENLGRALDAMYQDSLIMEVLGEPYVSVYGKAKRKEWKSYLAQVTEWEISQYLYML